MRRFDEVFAAHKWREIRGCPGRYIAREIPAAWGVTDLLGEPVSEHVVHYSRARDGVVVTPLEGGGLISYKRSDGTYLHTLNTSAGFQRKLNDLK